MKFGCCTTMENYDALCRMGYDYIELPGVYVSKLTDAQVDEAAKRIKDAGVPCAGYNAYCNQEVPIVGPNFDAKVVEAYAKKCAKEAQNLGSKILELVLRWQENCRKGLIWPWRTSSAVSF